MNLLLSIVAFFKNHALLVWQGRLMHLCRRHRAALAGAFLLCVARLLRPRYGGRRLPKA